MNGRPSSLIQVARFGESPVIVPHEVHDCGLNVLDRGSLAEKNQSYWLLQQILPLEDLLIFP
jgi:hypothetical protein